MGITLIKNKKNKEYETLVGAYMPQHLSSFISLYALSKEVSKTQIIKNVFKNWAKRQQNKQYYIKIIQENINAKWKENKIKQKYPFGIYKAEIRIYLTKKLVSADVEAIMKGIK